MATLVVRSNRVVDPATGRDGPGEVAVRDGRIVDRVERADRAIDVGDAVVLPGLVDLHAHPANAGSRYGVDPDRRFLPRGVTTVQSQGDAGADNVDAYVEHTVAAARTRVRLAINISRVAESAEHRSLAHMEHVDVDACVAAIERHGDIITGISINVSHGDVGDNDPRAIVARGIDAATCAQRRILYGMHEPGRWPFEQQMAMLRPGDVVTYIFRQRPHDITQGGKVHAAIRAAQQRGVLFDVGHGMGSFVWDVAQRAMDDGFEPHTISTDAYVRHNDMDPPHDLPRVMSKLLAVGMAERDVFAAVTVRPAALLGLAGEVGTLAPGACADIVALRWRDDAALADVQGAVRRAGCYEPMLVVRGGVVAAEGAVG